MAGAENKNNLYNLITTTSDVAGGAGSTLKRSLQIIRSHLGMEVAYVSEFVDGRSVFREVDAPGQEALIKPGDSYPLDESYCRHILEGRLPQIIPDTSAVPLAAAMPVTKAVPIGAHMSVPIRLPDGRAYGMFCCLGFQSDHSLNERDLQMMKAFADLAAFEISQDLEAKQAAEEKRLRILSVIGKERISIHYQPIWNVETRRPVGLECLSRFAASPSRPPDAWFNEAAEVGLGDVLELSAIRMALTAFSSSLPGETYLAVNASPATILSADFPKTLENVPLNRVVLEITEHAHVESYDHLLDALKPLRVGGLRLAVDDAGAGYSGLQHILHLRPDLIKLDMDLTRHIDIDPARRALASALIKFASETDSQIIAEGVETASELKTLKALGVQRVQGYFLARPMTLGSAIELFRQGPVQDTCVA
jgi:EAL domain-containing protein (putative c-di-GMP-specific phosphodiesterase class I)